MYDEPALCDSISNTKGPLHSNYIHILHLRKHTMFELSEISIAILPPPKIKAIHPSMHECSIQFTGLQIVDSMALHYRLILAIGFQHIRIRLE